MGHSRTTARLIAVAVTALVGLTVAQPPMAVGAAVSRTHAPAPAHVPGPAPAQPEGNGPPARPTAAQRSWAEQQKAQVLRTAASSKAAAADLPPGGFGNGIFHVYVNPADGEGAGEFTVLTGPQHPAGPGRNVLFGDGTPGTSYLIVRDISPSGAVTDYVQGQLLTHPSEVSLDGVSSTQKLTGSTMTTTWYPGGFEITQTVAVTGDTVANSRVTVSTAIQDTSAQPDHYQIQYLWDTEVGTDDGPVTQPRTAGVPYGPFDPTIGVEQTTASFAGDTVTVDAHADPHPPTFAVAASGADNPQAVPDTTKYVCWPDAIYAPIGEYATDSTRDISGANSDCLNSVGHADSALEYLWSLNPATGPSSVTASLRTSPPTPYATTLKAGRLSLGTATATLTDTATGKPVAGRLLTFSGGGSTCTVTTDANGSATCGSLLGGLLGYDVKFTGDAIWAPSTAHGGVLFAAGPRIPKD